MLKYQNIFQIKYKEAISSNSTVIVRYYQNADAVLKDNFIVLFIIIFGTLSFPIKYSVHCTVLAFYSLGIIFINRLFTVDNLFRLIDCQNNRNVAALTGKCPSDPVPRLASLTLTHSTVRAILITHDPITHMIDLEMLDQ